MASGFEVVDRGHCKVLLHELNEQRIQGIFCDVTIVVQDSKFKAHKNILAAFSRYFKELLASQGLWAMEPVLELREMKAEIFAKILNFIYSSRVVVERLEEADDLASAGHRLGIHFLKELLDLPPQPGTSDHQLPSSVQSSLSQSPDPSRMPAKEDDHRSQDFQNAMPLRLWPTDSPFPPESLAGPTFPIDLTAPATQRHPGEMDRPPPAAYQSPIPESSADHPPEHPSSEREGSEPRPRREGGEICADERSSLDGLFQADFLKGASREVAEEVHEAAKRLYTLSTAAFRGLGFSVEESANPVAPPPKEPAAPAVEDPGAAWVQPPVTGSPEEEEVGGVTLPTPSAAYPPSVLTCGLCARSFSTVAALSLHGKLHRPGKALSCRHCRKTFVHVKRLHTHQTLCRRAEGAPSPGGRRRSLTGPGPRGEEEEEEEKAEEPHPPPPPPLDLLLAESGSGGGGGRKLPRVDPLTEEEHFIKVVDGHLLYFCAVCERSYVTLSSLKRHANVHSWRRKYPCRYCDKVFALAEYRTKHEVWHTGERRYQCIFCWETFVTYYNLKTHQKSFHGVDPGLTISQKTPNGGYKPKLNAFKLYRLLPMRSQKRPYKTYSHTVSTELLKFAHRAPAPLPENDLSQPPSAPKHDKGQSPAEGRHSPERQAAPSAPESLHGPLHRESPALPIRDGGSPQRGFSGCRAATASGEGPTPQPPPPPHSSLFPEGAAAVPSVITYGRPAPSVIVHSNALLPAPPQRAQSSVIAYNGRCPREEEGVKEGEGPSARQPRETSASPPGSPAKRQSSGEKAASACPAATNQRHQRQKEPRSQKPKRHLLLPARGKAVTYVAKPACAGAAAESRGAPLCQITMRIGEEAIVKRRISESDLIRDKDGGGKGRRRCEGPQTGGKRNSPEREEAGGSRQKRSDYFLGNESGEEVSDNDIDDNLWRPYYSYKPKRRPGGFHKAKKSGWRRKLRYRHSPRWLQRAAKGTDREERPESMDCRPPEPDKDQDGAQQPADPSQPGCSSSSSSSSPVIPRRCTQGAFACLTCGEVFPTLRSLRKHEECQPEPGQLDCRSCDRVFNPAKEETQSGHKLWPPPPLPASPPQGAPRLPPAPGDSRRAAGRHACAHCPKTCKTAAALGRHQKRHLAGQRPGAPSAAGGPGQGQNGGLPSERFGQPERAPRGALRPSTLEEEEDCSPRGDRNGVTGTPSASEGENLKLLQRNDHLPTIAPYTEDCASGARAPETEICPLLHRIQNPTHLPGRETPGQELVGPKGIPLRPMHQLMLAQGAESHRAETPVSQGIYSNNATGSAPQEQEVLPLISRGQSVPDPPAMEGEAQDGTVMPCAEDDGEGLPLRNAGDEVRDFHTLEAMGAREAAGFEERGHGLELARDSEYPTQEYPLPLLTSGNCRLQTGLEGKALAFHPGAARFKEGGEDLSKVALYQDPYQLVYGHQLLAGAYPYNFAHISPLPVALNMVIRDEKGQQLPLLHRMFVYPPTPCRDEAAPPLLAPPPPPPLGAAGNGSRDDVARELLAGEKGTSMY